MNRLRNAEHARHQARELLLPRRARALHVLTGGDFVRVAGSRRGSAFENAVDMARAYGGLDGVFGMDALISYLEVCPTPLPFDRLLDLEALILAGALAVFYRSDGHLFVGQEREHCRPTV